MANADAFGNGFSMGKGAAGKSKKDKPGSENEGVFAKPNTYKKGGKVKKTGLAKVHKGEVVLTTAEVKKISGKKSSKKHHKKLSPKR